MLYRNVAELAAEVRPYWAEVAKEGKTLKTLKVEMQRGFEAIKNARESQVDLIVLGGPSIRENWKLTCTFGSLATETQVDQKKMRQYFLTLTQPSPPSEKQKLKATLEDNKENAENPPALRGAASVRSVKGKALAPLSTNPQVRRKQEEDHAEVRKKVAEHLKKGSILNESNWWVFRNDCFMIGAIQGDREFHIATKGIPSDDLLWDAENDRPHVLGRELIMLEMQGYQRITANQKLGIVLAPPVGGTDKGITLRAYRDRIAAVTSVEEIKEIFDKLHSNTCARTVLNPEQFV